MTRTRSRGLLIALSVQFVLAADIDVTAQPVDRAPAVTVLRHVTLVPMTTEMTVDDQTVVIEGSRISAVGPADAVIAPKGARIVDGSGRFLMPGLADMHMHTSGDWLGGGSWPVSPLALYLANGVTTIRCFGHIGRSPDIVLQWRDWISRGSLAGPTIYTAGSTLHGGLKRPAEELRRQHVRGFDFAKFYSAVSENAFREGMVTARALGFYTAGHIPFAVGLDGVLAHGMDEIAHIEELDLEFLEFDRDMRLEDFDSDHDLARYKIFRHLVETTAAQVRDMETTDPAVLAERYGPRIKEIVEKLKTYGVPVNTTLAVGDVVVKKLHQREAFLARPENRYLRSAFLERFRRGEDRHQSIYAGYESLAEFRYTADLELLDALNQGGVPLLLGTDSGAMGIVPGFSIHDELSILVSNGLTPYQALAAGTVTAARTVAAMGMQDDFGTIEVGNRADLILIDGNPLDDVGNVRRPLGVMAAGRWYDREALDAMLEIGIPLAGRIQHAHEPDGGRATYLEIFVGKGFSGNLPGAIDAIEVIGPGGRLPIAGSDFRYLPQLRDFWVRLAGAPEVGPYTFRVSSGEARGAATALLSTVTTIPIVSSRSMLPESGGRIAAEMPAFSWKTVTTDVPLYYRLEIRSEGGRRVYSSGYVKNMSAHTLPAGIVEPGKSYSWRVRVSDGYDWRTAANRSHTDWRGVTIR